MIRVANVPFRVGSLGIRRRAIGTMVKGPIGSSTDAPLLIAVLLVASWILTRLIEAPEGLAAVVVVGCLVALRWPATGMALASLAIIFPLRSGGLESGSPLLVASAIGCLAAASRSPGRFIVHPTFVFGAALAASAGLALFRTISDGSSEVVPDASLRWAGLVLGLVSLPIHMFLFQQGARQGFAVLIGATAVAVGLGLIDGIWPHFLDQTVVGPLLSNVPSDRANGPYPSPNRLATVAAITAAGAWVLAARAQGWWRTAVVLMAAIATVVVVASFSRGALVGLALAAVVVIARRSVRMAAALSVFGAAVILLAAPTFMDVRLGFAPISSGRPAEQAANDAGRVDAWLAGLRMGVDRPLTGHGYGSFAQEGPAYGGPADLRTAHNEMIALFAETGLPGVVSFGGLIGACLWAFRGRAPSDDIGLATVIVFVTASSFNVQSVYPQVMITVWAVVAWGLTDVFLRSGATSRQGVADGRALPPF